MNKNTKHPMLKSLYFYKNPIAPKLKNVIIMLRKIYKPK